MSYCESCGRELRTGAVFCGSCGAQVLPAFAAPQQATVAQGGQVPPAPATAAPYARPQSPPVQSSGTGVALVVIGAVMALLVTFVYYTWYSSSYDGFVDQGWFFDSGTGAWTRLWPPKELFFESGSWSPLIWFQQISYVAVMITTLLCVVAAILAILRASGARVGGGIIRAFGIAAVIAMVAYIISGLASSEYRWLAVTDLAALAGAILIIIGGGLLGPAAGPASTPGARLPARGPGGTY